MTRRRAIILAVVYLLCGFVVNMLVAWGLAFWVNPDGLVAAETAWSGPEMDYDSWFVGGNTFAGYARWDSNWLDSGFADRAPADPDGEPGSLLPSWLTGFTPSGGRSGRHARRATAWGLPTVSFWWEESGDVAGPGAGPILPVGPRIDAGEVSRDVSFSPATVTVPRILPIRPIWPNTIYNTLFYATILLGAHQGFIAIKRTRRKRRGLCPRCRYELRGTLSEGCPECGWRR